MFRVAFLCVCGFSESDQDWHLALNELPRLHCLSDDTTKFRFCSVAARILCCVLAASAFGCTHQGWDKLLAAAVAHGSDIAINEKFVVHKGGERHNGWLQRRKSHDNDAMALSLQLLNLCDCES